VNRRPWLYYLIAPAQMIDGLRDLAVQLGDGGEAERLNFSIPVALASDPASIVAYGGGTGPVGDATREHLESAVLPTLPPQVAWCRVHNEPSPARVARSSDPVTQARLDAGETLVWDLPTALERVGMVLWRDPNLVLPGLS